MTTFSNTVALGDEVIITKPNAVKLDKKGEVKQLLTDDDGKVTGIHVLFPDGETWMYSAGDYRRSSELTQ